MSKKLVGLSTKGDEVYYNEDGTVDIIPPKKLFCQEVESKGMKYDGGKLQLNLITEPMITGLGEVLTFGANKYAPNSWQHVPDAVERYKAALLRHYTAWIGGEDLDVESKLHHVKHILCNAAFLVDLIEEDGRSSEDTRKSDY